MGCNLWKHLQWLRKVAKTHKKAGYSDVYYTFCL